MYRACFVNNNFKFSINILDMVSHGISWCEYNIFASLWLYVKVFQFKLHLFYEIPFLEKKNIAKELRKISKSNLESHLQYQVTHKICNGRIKFFWHKIVVCHIFIVCYKCGTRQNLNFAVCFFLCRVPFWRVHGIVSPLPCVGQPGRRQRFSLLFVMC